LLFRVYCESDEVGRGAEAETFFRLTLLASRLPETATSIFNFATSVLLKPFPTAKISFAALGEAKEASLGAMRTTGPFQVTSGLSYRPLKARHTITLVQHDVVMFCMASVYTPYFVKCQLLCQTLTDGSLPFRPLVHEAMEGPGTWGSEDTWPL
jgi:hypothetical protein